MKFKEIKDFKFFYPSLTDQISENQKRMLDGVPKWRKTIAEAHQLPILGIKKEMPAAEKTPEHYAKLKQKVVSNYWWQIHTETAQANSKEKYIEAFLARRSLHRKSPKYWKIHRKMQQLVARVVKETASNNHDRFIQRIEDQIENRLMSGRKQRHFSFERMIKNEAWVQDYFFQVLVDRQELGKMGFQKVIDHMENIQMRNKQFAKLRDHRTEILKERAAAATLRREVTNSLSESMQNTAKMFLELVDARNQRNLSKFVAKVVQRKTKRVVDAKKYNSQTSHKISVKAKIREAVDLPEKLIRRVKHIDREKTQLERPEKAQQKTQDVQKEKVRFFSYLKDFITFVAAQRIESQVRGKNAAWERMLTSEKAREVLTVRGYQRVLLCLDEIKIDRFLEALLAAHNAFDPVGWKITHDEVTKGMLATKAELLARMHEDVGKQQGLLAAGRLHWKMLVLKIFNEKREVRRQALQKRTEKYQAFIKKSVLKTIAQMIDKIDLKRAFEDFLRLREEHFKKFQSINDSTKLRIRQLMKYRLAEKTEIRKTQGKKENEYAITMYKALSNRITTKILAHHEYNRTMLQRRDELGNWRAESIQKKGELLVQQHLRIKHSADQIQYDLKQVKIKGYRFRDESRLNRVKSVIRKLDNKVLLKVNKGAKVLKKEKALLIRKTVAMQRIFQLQEEKKFAVAVFIKRFQEAQGIVKRKLQLELLKSGPDLNKGPMPGEVDLNEWKPKSGLDLNAGQFPGAVNFNIEHLNMDLDLNGDQINLESDGNEDLISEELLKALIR